MWHCVNFHTLKMGTRRNVRQATEAKYTAAAATTTFCRCVVSLVPLKFQNMPSRPPTRLSSFSNILQAPPVYHFLLCRVLVFRTCVCMFVFFVIFFCCFSYYAAHTRTAAHPLACMYVYSFICYPHPFVLPFLQLPLLLRLLFSCACV